MDLIFDKAGKPQFWDFLGPPDLLGLFIKIQATSFFYFTFLELHAKNKKKPNESSLRSLLQTDE